MTHHSDFDPWQEPKPKEYYVTEKQAKVRLWSGIICTAVVCGILSALGVL